jgi:glucokinase
MAMIIGVDIGGTNIKAGLVSNDKIIRKVSIKTGKTKKDIIDNIIKAIFDLSNSKIKAIGIGAPGPADYEKGIIKNTPNLPLKNVNLKKIISKKFKKKVVMANDANCFVLGESIRLKKKNIVGLTLGTGIGGGIVVDGELYTGKGNAGELGHCTIKFDGMQGLNQGDLESYISAKAIKKRYRKDPIELSKKEFKEIGSLLGAGIANMINTFDPGVVVLGGGISGAFSKFKTSMNKEIKKRAVNKTRVIKGNPESGIIGAAALFK